MHKYSKLKIAVSTKALYYVSIFNCLLFFLLSLVGFTCQISIPTYIILMLGIFGVISSLVFIVAIKNGYILDPIYTFNFGAGIFFGLGTIPAFLNLYDQSSVNWYGGNSSQDILKVSILNSLSVFIIWTIAFFANSKVEHKKILIPFKIDYKYYLFAFFIILLLKIFNFSDNENLIYKSILDKLSIFLISVILIGAIIKSRIKTSDFYLFAILICASSFLGILSASKYEFMLPFTTFFIGSIVNGASNKKIVVNILILLSIYLVGSLWITTIRGHCEFEGDASLTSRMKISISSLGTLITKRSDCENNVKNGTADPLFVLDTYVRENTSIDFGERGQLSKLLRRLNTSSIATFLIHQYDIGAIGNSINNIHVYFIPRIIWKEKPLTTNYAKELSSLYYPGQKSNSLGPTYVAELYWNFGILGVVTGSIIFGIILSGLSRLANLCYAGIFLDYLIIAIPALIYAVWLESWVGPTFIGGIVSIGQTLLIWLVLKGSYRYFLK